MSTSRGPRGSLPGTTGERRRARERALGLLYERELKGLPIVDLLAELPIAPEPYAVGLALGVEAHLSELDALIVAHAKGWALTRMPSLDRQLLRLGCYELAHEPEVPTAVVIDEEVELAKQYSTEDSSRFVNGVLAAVARELRDDATARPA